VAQQPIAIAGSKGLPVFGTPKHSTNSLRIAATSQQNKIQIETLPSIRALALARCPFHRFVFSRVGIIRPTRSISTTTFPASAYACGPGASGPGFSSTVSERTLGIAPALTLAVARKTAAALHARVRLGEDPAAAKHERQRRAADTVEAAFRAYLPAKKAELRSSSYTSTERHLLRYAKPLHGLGVALVGRRDIGGLLTTIAISSGSPTANRARASLSAFFAWCMARTDRGKSRDRHPRRT
jgi:hypothetical protein